MVKISIIIPTYKPQEYIWNCLNSIKRQTIKPELFEILIILNGCKEPYESTIKKYVSTNLKNITVKILQTDVAGVSNARNIGIDCSQGEFICFIDDDDQISPNYIESLLKISDKDTMGCSYSLSFKDNINDLQENFISKHYKKCINKPYSTFQYRVFFSAPFGKLIHKKIVGNERFNTNLNYSEDSVFCFSISKRVRMVSLTDMSVCYFINKRSGSVTRKKINLRVIYMQFFIIEFTYLKKFFQDIFSYNILFVLSRMAAALRNALRLSKYNN